VEKPCKAAGVPARLIHDDRRSAVRNLGRAGISRWAAMKMTGHKTKEVYHRYTIVDSAMLQEAAAKLSALHSRWPTAKWRESYCDRDQGMIATPFKNALFSATFLLTREWRNGRRAGLRIQCRKAWGFKSPLSHLPFCSLATDRRAPGPGLGDPHLMGAARQCSTRRGWRRAPKSDSPSRAGAAFGFCLKAVEFGSIADLDLFEFLAQHGPEFRCHLLCKAGALYVVSECVVDQCLIVAAMGSPNLIPEMINDIVVQSYSDAHFFRRQWDHRSALPFTEVILALHILLSSYCRRSRAVAFHAEII
jgi:hypothetical protein